ncbi:hypothetical protein STEG23_011158, partial [Scotinomys teguina]
MRTYWLHSVWVLGFFLSLFSLQEITHLTYLDLNVPLKYETSKDLQKGYDISYIYQLTIMTHCELCLYSSFSGFTFIQSFKVLLKNSSGHICALLSSSSSASSSSLEFCFQTFSTIDLTILRDDADKYVLESRSDPVELLHPPELVPLGVAVLSFKPSTVDTEA